MNPRRQAIKQMLDQLVAAAPTPLTWVQGWGLVCCAYSLECLDRKIVGLQDRICKSAVRV